MRGWILALAAGLALAASAQAAPLAPNPASIELAAASPVELVRDGCGRGWHRARWRDQWGNWQWGDCVPDGGPYGGSGAGWYYPPSSGSYYPPSYWRGVPPPWGWGNP
jgi:hypothetical protein